MLQGELRRSRFRTPAVRVTLPDGSARDLPAGATGLDRSAVISSGLVVPLPGRERASGWR
jgi:hypothetical protein